MIMLLFDAIPETQATLALGVFLLSFAYEDGATLLAAALGAAGRLDVRLGLVSAFLGIWIGDMGLYALGSGIGRRAVSSRWSGRFLSPESLAKAETWFQRRGPLAIVISRFVPGSRLPLYMAAGALQLPLRLFTTLTGICSAVWVGAIFTAWHFAPKTGLHNTSLVALALLLGPVLFSKAGATVFKRARVIVRKYRRWEFWPAWMFYPPVAAMCAWLAVKYRGLALPALSNPSFRNGGMVGESKAEILQALMQAAPEFVADGYLISAGNLTLRLEQIDRLCSEQGIDYPFVLKPNVGQRGAGFKIVTSPEAARQYLAQVDADVLFQRYVDAPKEAGVFYYRFPGQRRGEIFGVTEKVFPNVVGDGVSTFDELLAVDSRASLIAATYLKRFPELRGRVLPGGQRIRLVEAGNHCQGCVFRDGRHLITDTLRDRIDAISRQIPGFFIGRYDLRYASDDDLRRGENFKILELNGAASEATNIYDERNSLLTAYRTLYRQWELVYAIGRANRDLGHKTPSIVDFLKDWNLYRTISADYPAAD